MALWLVAVIVLIAVCAMPSGAEAHDGHRHPATDHATIEQAGPAALAVATPTASVKVAAAVFVRTGIQAPASIGLACDGPCCNSGCRPGTSCCTGAGLAAESDESGPPRRPGARALARALPARTDVVPEALPEPPRPFA